MHQPCPWIDYLQRQLCQESGVSAGNSARCSNTFSPVSHAHQLGRLVSRLPYIFWPATRYRLVSALDRVALCIVHPGLKLGIGFTRRIFARRVAVYRRHHHDAHVHEPRFFPSHLIS